MKKDVFLATLLFVMTGLGILCTPSVAPTPSAPLPATLQGKWILTDTQSAGIGPPGVWAVASPSGRWMELNSAAKPGGTVFPDATGYQLIDSVTLKVIDPTQIGGFRLFNYRIDTVANALFFYKRPANGGYCIEGCGALRFGR